MSQFKYGAGNLADEAEGISSDYQSELSSDKAEQLKENSSSSEEVESLESEDEGFAATMAANKPRRP